jgi:pilus assembly protein Flp/PilA
MTAHRRTPYEYGERSILLTFANKIQRAFSFCSHPARMKTIRSFLADETGATAIEYGLIAAGIALAIITAVNGLGTKLSSKFVSISTSLK